MVIFIGFLAPQIRKIFKKCQRHAYSDLESQIVMENVGHGDGDGNMVDDNVSTNWPERHRLLRLRCFENSTGDVENEL